MKISICGLMCRLLFLTFALILTTGSTIAKKRVALVIGNSAYENTAPLKNSVNDANLMAISLKNAGFEVTKLLDADYRTLKRAMLTFGRSLRDGPEAGLFYYAGHGIQVRGKNYLVPVNAKINDEDEVDLEAIDVNAFLQVMESSSSDINIIVLDACRNNPFARSFRSAAQGLATIDAPKGTFIAYATAPGSVASDGLGDNSPYTVALSKAIEKQGLTIEQVFKSTRVSVLKQTASKQVPWETSSITGNFFFHSNKIETVQLPVVKTPTVQLPVLSNSTPAISTRNEAENVYKQIKDSQNVDVLEIFAEQFPNSIYTKFIRARIKSLEENNSTKTTLLDNNKAISRNNQDSDGASLYRSAEAAYERKDYTEAVRLYSLAVGQNNADAMNKLAIMYEIGKGVDIDIDQAIRLFEKAAANGHVRASRNLASLKLFQKNQQNSSTDDLGNLSPVELARNIQTELNRLGCEAGTVNGKWSFSSRQALEQYKLHSSTKVVSIEPTTSLLEKLRGHNSRICTLNCRLGYKVVNNQCVRTTLESQIISQGCKDLYRDFKKNGPIGAFSISTDGKFCGTSWNYNTKSEASKSALSYCTEEGGNGCKILTISKPASRPQSKECKDLFKQWKKQNGSKAFAVSGSGQACGYGAEYSSGKDASNRALKECKQQAKGCHIIASKS
jgi:tetratricopeptide (TPR) repeat protein